MRRDGTYKEKLPQGQKSSRRRKRGGGKNGGENFGEAREVCLKEEKGRGGKPPQNQKTQRKDKKERTNIVAVCVKICDAMRQISTHTATIKDILKMVVW